MIKDYDYYANEFVEGILEQQRGTWELLGRPFIKKQEKRYEKAVNKLRESEEGVNVFARLLTHDNALVAVTAAVYLLKTSAEMKAVDTLRQYAKEPEEDFLASCARLRLEEWEKSNDRQ